MPATLVSQRTDSPNGCEVLETVSNTRKGTGVDSKIFVGIDVCKAWLDVAAVCSLEQLGLPARVDNDEQGRSALTEQRGV